MDFQLTEEQVALQQAARRYAQERLPAIARELEATAEPPSHELIHEYAEMGFLGINIPESLGGLGLGNLEALLVIEEFGKVSSAVAFPVFESCVGPVRAIERFGQRWCSGGGHAGGYVVYCRLSDDPGAKGIGAVYVEAGTPGLTFGNRESLMGFRGVPSADLYFEDVRLPLENVVVPAGGFKKLMEAFDLERCGNATMALAQASGALDDVLAYVQERHQFGRALVEFQAVQVKLAEMRMRVDAARLLIHRAACNAEKGMPSIIDSSIAKCFANEIAREVCGNAMQLMGAYGYSKDYPMERRLRDSWGWGIAGGAVDIQKVNIAAAMVGRRFDQRR